MIDATVNSKSQKLHLTFCSCTKLKICGISDPDSDLHHFYIDTVVQLQSMILNTDTIDSEEVYAGLHSYFVNVLMKAHCIMFIIISLIHPYFPIFFTRNNMNCYLWASKLYRDIIVKEIYKECSVVRIDPT